MKHKFYKGPDGIIFFFLVQFVFLLQILFVASITDYNDKDEANKFLILHKFFFYIFLFFSFFSHFKASTVDPGSITPRNNQEIVEFYNFIHEPLIKNAIRITEKKTEQVVRKMIFEADDKVPDENEIYDITINEENDSDKDEYKFVPKTAIGEELRKAISKRYRLKLTRCKNCYVVRPINAHHCNMCHLCYLEQDHHCPWINNCVGLFNKKYFNLFNFYALITVLYSLFLFFYFSLYKNFDDFKGDTKYITMSIIYLLVELIYGIFVAFMLYSQFDGIIKSRTLCDYRNGILLEKSSTKQQFQMIFGGTFSFKWLLPFYPGGNSAFFEQMCEVIKLKKLQSKNRNKKEESEDDEDEEDRYNYKVKHGQKPKQD